MSSLEKKIRVLFIGNSHTYYNDMPELFRERAERDGFACEVTMLAHGGWRLSQHAKGTMIMSFCRSTPIPSCPLRSIRQVSPP